jgi:hypothetical protein
MNAPIPHLTPITTPIASLDTLIWGPECPAKDHRFKLLSECDDADRVFHTSFERHPAELPEARRQATVMADMARFEHRIAGDGLEYCLDSIMETTLDGKVDVPTYRFIRALAALELDRVSA